MSWYGGPDPRVHFREQFVNQITSPDTDAWEGRRADARRNHERVLAAAIEVFTEHGLDATMPQVAARAGVGKATVYRSYPSRTALVNALARMHAVWLRDRVAEAARRADVDARAALGAFLDEVVTRLAEDRLMVEVLSRSTEDLEDDTSNEHFEHVLDRGREQGVLRDDVSQLDVRVLLSGVARALVDLDVTDPAVWRRYAGLVLAALRP